MIRNLTIYIAIIASFISLRANDFTPDMMPNVNVTNRYEFVSDPGNLLSPATKDAVNRRLWDLRQQTSVEAVVAIPPSIGETTIEDWSEQLFTLWGIGKKDKDNGVLLVIAPEQRRARITTGYGVEGVLPDISCKNIINSAIIPNMREGDINRAVDDATNLVSQVLTDPAVAEEIRSRQPDNHSGTVNALSGEVIWKFIRIVATCAFLFSLVMFVRYLFKGRKKSDNYHKAIMWRDSLPVFGWTALLSLGSGIIFLAFAFLLYRSYRTRKLKCTTCGTRMNRLKEEEDNELLSDSQDFEEKLDTIDYDVWECPHCGTIERYAFKKNQQKYTECPKCHTVAMCQIGTRTIVPATTHHQGTGEKIYECKFCHNQKRKQFVIPRKESAAPFIAGAAIGAMTGHRGNGGGGFGGGFGGGSTGGGGASGGW